MNYQPASTPNRQWSLLRMCVASSLVFYRVYRGRGVCFQCVCVCVCVCVSVCVRVCCIKSCYFLLPHLPWTFPPSTWRPGGAQNPQAEEIRNSSGDFVCVFVVLAQNRKQACSDILLPSCRAPNGSATGSGSSGCMACGSHGTAGRASSWRGLGGSGAVLPAQLWAQPECRRNQKNLENHSGVGA